MIKSIAGPIIDIVAPPKLPIVQKVRPLSSESSLIYVRIPIPTPAKAFTAIPASSKYVMPSFPNPLVIKNNADIQNEIAQY